MTETVSDPDHKPSFTIPPKGRYAPPDVIPRRVSQEEIERIRAEGVERFRHGQLLDHGDIDMTTLWERDTARPTFDGEIPPLRLRDDRQGYGSLVVGQTYSFTCRNCGIEFERVAKKKTSWWSTCSKTCKDRYRLRNAELYWNERYAVGDTTIARRLVTDGYVEPEDKKLLERIMRGEEFDADDREGR